MAESVDVIQPLDRSYFRGLKTALRISWATVVAKEAILANMDEHKQVEKHTWPTFLAWWLVASMTSIRTTGDSKRRHLKVESEKEVLYLVAQANALQCADLLFPMQVLPIPAEQSLDSGGGSGA